MELTNLITQTNGIATTTSLDVARVFGKRHVHLVEAIVGLLSDLPDHWRAHFEEIEVEIPRNYGGAAKYPGYRMTRDGFTLLAMGFTGAKALQFKTAYIDAFNTMERALLGQGEPPDLTVDQARREAAIAAEVHALRVAIEERDLGVARQLKELRMEMARSLGKAVRIAGVQRDSTRPLDPNRPLSPEEVERFKYYVSVGLSVKEIARRLNRTFDVIRRFIDQNGDVVLASLQRGLL